MAFGLLVIWLLVPPLRPEPWIVGGFFTLLALGTIDDRRELPALHKLGIEVAVVAIALIASGLTLEHLGTLLPGIEVDPGWLALPIAVFGVVSVLNALNMIDGVDGLSGSVALVGFVGLSLVALLAGDGGMMQVALVPGAALGGFLVYNLRLPGRAAARVFMGDAGSLSIGFLLGVFAIAVCQNPAVPAITTVWMVALPLLDGLTVIQRRSARGVGMTQPGADHLHHLLRAAGFGAGAICMIEGGGATLLAAFGILLWQLGAEEWFSLLSLLILALVFRMVSDRAWLTLTRHHVGESGPLSDEQELPLAVGPGTSALHADEADAPEERTPRR